MKAARYVPFLIGRITREGSRIIFLQPPPPPPIPGPWELRGVFAA